ERLGAAAQPLRFLDYLIDGPVRGAVVNGGGILVNVPRPARFAIHKLILASERPVATHAKRGKDLAQAAEVLGTLVEERPGDVEQAWRDLLEYGHSYVRRAQQGLAALEKRDVGVAEQVQAEIGA
ncbi:MAG: nucleotidyltransferase domain-containing protein, partial [Coriobacteriia bacterium]|nr:nucleotidyltransferase domain-containing protein [Coriobacteriia bacterium]